MPFSSYDAHGLRLLWHAHSEAMTRLQKTDLTESARAVLSKQVVENLMKAYDSGLRDPTALYAAGLRGVRRPSGIT